jgi:hypothetical protein
MENVSRMVGSVRARVKPAARLAGRGGHGRVC